MSGAQHLIEMVEQIVDLSAERGVIVLRGAGLEAEPQFQCDTALEEEQRLVVFVPDQIEHRSENHVRHPSLLASDGDAAVALGLGDPALQDLDVVRRHA